MKYGLFALLFLAACGDDAATPASSIDGGSEVRLAVPDTGRVYLKLAGGTATATDWDLAFEGMDVFTNSGVSGTGMGAGFGPLDDAVFLGDTAPSVPFVTQDKAGGAFLDWYAYDGTTHALWSRYHVVGVKEGTRLWKVQVLTYYGERDNATISGIYKIRYQELTGTGPAVELDDLDGTAGGTSAPATTPSECLDLGTGARPMLTPAAALASTEWQLCFRRANITVNGETGGPRGVMAFDLEGSDTATEPLASVEQLTSDGEKPLFDRTNASAFDGKAFRGDHVVSVFSDAWIDTTQTPIVPKTGAWLVVDATGNQKYLLAFTGFENPTTQSPGTVVMRIKPVKG